MTYFSEDLSESKSFFLLSFRIYTLQSLKVDQHRVPDSVFLSSFPPPLALAAMALAARLGNGPQLCPNVLAAALQHMAYSFFPSCYSVRETMLSPSYRPLFRNGESIFSLLKGHEGQRGSEQVFASTLRVEAECWYRSLLSLNSQSSLQRAIQTLRCGALFRSMWQPISSPVLLFFQLIYPSHSPSSRSLVVLEAPMTLWELRFLRD